jgi:tetratricopeptide (TPR) repeat protein
MNRLSVVRRISVAVTSAIAIAITLAPLRSLAGDPFRSSNPRNISSQTEAAFNAFFKEGNYPKATNLVQEAEASQPSEPMVYALQAALAYNKGDWGTVKAYSSKTLAMAEQLGSSDALRGHIYTAVGHLLDAAYTFQNEGPLAAVNKLQTVFKSIEDAEKIDDKDPELNLVKGYMDLLLAVYLPFSDTARTIEKLESDARPAYLAYRGIAVAYRDLNQNSKALDYAERVFSEIPNNPEVVYLKAQLLFKKGADQKNLATLNNAKKLFNESLEKRQQLPKGLVAQIGFERCQVQIYIDNQNRDCTAKFNQINAMPGVWGPAELPPLD